MTEPIEKWREEFENSEIGKEYSTRKNTDIESPYYYEDYHVDLMFQSWLAAKRSTPVVELPKPYIEWDYDENPIKYWTKRQLDEAGINYRIKGE